MVRIWVIYSCIHYYTISALEVVGEFAEVPQGLAGLRATGETATLGVIRADIQTYAHIMCVYRYMCIMHTINYTVHTYIHTYVRTYIHIYIYTIYLKCCADIAYAFYEVGLYYITSTFSPKQLYVFFPPNGEPLRYELFFAA